VVRDEADAAFASGNGRLEAVEINIASRLPGRVEAVLVQEGEWVNEGQVLARMDTRRLVAERNEALAKTRQAQHAALVAAAQVAVQEGQQGALNAALAERRAAHQAATARLARMASLAARGVISAQALEDERLRLDSANAALLGALAEQSAGQAAIAAARAAAGREDASIAANQASVERIEADIADSHLKAPRAGRVQYRVALPGEVVAAGGVVLNLADLSEVFMTFFLPEKAAGRLALGAEVRIVLDAAPEVVIPAQVSFVASIAQFTPKTVETESERQKLMFRIKARVASAVLARYRDEIKPGLPGVAWVRLDDSKPWPKPLALSALP
jgi:HlyD family secretion protein